MSMMQDAGVVLRRPLHLCTRHGRKGKRSRIMRTSRTQSTAQTSAGPRPRTSTLWQRGAWASRDGPSTMSGLWTSREHHPHHLHRRRPCARGEMLLGEVLHPYLYYCVVLNGLAQTSLTTSIVGGGLGGEGSGASHAQGRTRITTRRIPCSGTRGRATNARSELTGVSRRSSRRFSSRRFGDRDHLLQAR